MMTQEQKNYKTLSGKSIFQDNRINSYERYNNYRRLWIDAPKNEIVTDFPLNVDIELTNACNLQCPHCARTQKSWGSSKVGFMNFDIVNKIINEINTENGYGVKFSLRGEPLLYKNIAEVINKIDRNKILDYYFNTNGVALNKDLSKKFIKMQLPRVSISVGGWDKESFEKCQSGAKFEMVLNNVKTLRKLRDEYRSEYPKIRIQAVLKSDFVQHFDEFSEIWGQYADEVGGIDFRDETENSIKSSEKVDSFKCNFLWQRLVILWDGSVYPCLFHGVKDASDIMLGNIKDKTLKEFWHSDKMNALRKQHSSGESHLCKSCTFCSYRKSETDKLLNGKVR